MAGVVTAVARLRRHRGRVGAEPKLCLRCLDVRTAQTARIFEKVNILELDGRN